MAKFLAREALHNLEELHAGSSSFKAPTSDWMFHVPKFKPSAKDSQLETAKDALANIETQFEDLAGKTTLDH